MTDDELTILVQTDVPTEAKIPSAALLMWMHWTWLPFWIIAVIIWLWLFIQSKHPQVSVHGKNILNAFISFFLYCFCLNLFTFVTLVTFGLQAEHYLVAVGVYICVISVPCLWIYVLVSSVIVGLAARKGKILSYWWAIRFFKT